MSGNDANDCSFATPCRTFSAALNATDSGGHIVPLVSGGYGPLIITKPVSIVAPDGLFGGINALDGVTGIVINNPGGSVNLKGITINGIGVGKRGIDVDGTADVSIENVRISNFTGSAVYVRGTANAKIKIADSVIDKNKTGIEALGNTSLELVRSRLQGNINGLNALATQQGILVQAMVVDSVVTGQGSNDPNNGTCVSATPASGALANVYVTRSTISNCVFGINGSLGATITVSGSMVTGNFYGFFNFMGVAGVGGGAAFNSLGNNHLFNNAVDAAGQITTQLLK
jgi:hypothetical protein